MKKIKYTNLPDIRKFMHGDNTRCSGDCFYLHVTPGVAGFHEIELRCVLWGKLLYKKNNKLEKDNPSRCDECLEI